jgi:hypothetical protein
MITRLVGVSSWWKAVIMSDGIGMMEEKAMRARRRQKAETYI